MVGGGGGGSLTKIPLAREAWIFSVTANFILN